MDTAKILIDGRSQVIRLPKDYRFEEEEVYRKKTSQGVLLIPKKLNMGYLGEKSNQKHLLCSKETSLNLNKKEKV